MKKETEMEIEKYNDDRFRIYGEGAKYMVEKSWKNYLEYFLEYFSHYIKKDNSKTSLLDVGCGGGFISKELAERGFQVYGIDFSSEAIKFAQRQNPEINFQRSFIYKLPFPDEKFDIIICLGVFQTVLDPERALIEMARTLKREGTLIIRTLNTLSLSKAKKNNPFYNFYNPFILRKEMEKIGFTTCPPKGIYLFPQKLDFLVGLIIKIKLYKIFDFLFFPIFVFFSHSFYIDGIKKCRKINQFNRT